MQVTIIDFKKILYQDIAISIIAPGLNGYFQILENHASFISVLGYGLIKLSKSFNEKIFKIKINGGFLRVKNNFVVVIL
ncbi:F0F1 ATP synthase subunit epsilon [Blattabacterium sp. (Cryptocercus kyebangensis)]|uniref:F0F1 ATP synthase subunit epsilon n=1 Tax=Blattabacterium sp. (Cryptocercus kyebangensis) TaxID=298656 RepID=UPI000D7BADC0|nr:F0F1 ATP synthase subunit epsilon [Blattabacterium sp. (Cryptocercus kyebangensis)]AWU43540.1 F0F1 ATP synthase subunit epsilon [Blattabacterium sp. (Cryptocercus kyebangensis)]